MCGQRGGVVRSAQRFPWRSRQAARQAVGPCSSRSQTGGLGCCERMPLRSRLHAQIQDEPDAPAGDAGQSLKGHSDEIGIALPLKRG